MRATHGQSGTREFATWTDIQTRCHNPNATSYCDYGGRGIQVCDRWRSSFSNFLADMGRRPSNDHSIERDDVNGNYEPINCRWATSAEQGRNKRNTRMVEINGTTKRLQDWAKESGLLPQTLHIRLRQGGSGLALLAPSTRGGSVEFNGIRDTHAGWSRRTGIKTSTIAMRLTKYQWPVSVALTKGALL